MTNIFGTPGKREMKTVLFETGIKELEKAGWKVERVPRSGKSSVRRITKGTSSRLASIRTSQDTWIAFPRTSANDGWGTLADVDCVVAVSVDDRDKPRFAQVHIIDAEEMRARFDRAYEARKKAGHVLPKERGLWLSLYEKEAQDPINRVGAGAGLAHAPIARVALSKGLTNGAAEHLVEGGELQDVSAGTAEGKLQSTQSSDADEAPLTISEAKRRLAHSLGVAEASITISITS
jgi:hypothetical protein